MEPISTIEQFEAYVNELIENISKYKTSHSQNINLKAVLANYYNILIIKSRGIDMEPMDKEVLINIAYRKITALFTDRENDNYLSKAFLLIKKSFGQTPYQWNEIR